VTGHGIIYGKFGPDHLAYEYQRSIETTPQTISAGASTYSGQREKLAAEFDRATDIPANNYTVATVRPPEGVTTDEHWSVMTRAAANYENNLDYDLGAGVLPGAAGNGYNSNGFVTGLNNAVGGTISKDLGGFIGASKPVPRHYFGR
jgi:hypothetical protein